MRRHKTVDEYIESAEHWQNELRELRIILAASGLEETVKWGGPCYTCDGKNVVGLGAFKSYVGLWFYQGALLSDSEQVLINAQEGKTKALRQWRFSSASEIKPGVVNAYVREAIELARSGREIAVDRNRPLIVPAELKSLLAENSKAAAAFQTLTKGRQREYAEFIVEAKRDDTKARRLQKILPMILKGVGLNDRYK